MNNSNIQHHPRTTLVSVLGWVSLVGGILASLLAILYTALIYYMQRMDDGELWSQEELAAIPEGFHFFLDHMVLIGSFAGVYSLMTALAGFGVVRRRDWGRKIFIFLLAASIVLVFATLPTTFREWGAEGQHNFQFVAIFFGIVEVVMTIVFHGWLIWKLRTPKIRGEFVEPRPESLIR